MQITANNPDRKSWLNVSKNSDFPIQNIPFGVFLSKDNMITIGSRIGDYAIDLSALHQLGYFKDIELTDGVFLQDRLNEFIAHGRGIWRQVRNRIADIFDAENTKLQNKKKHKKQIIYNVADVEMHLPVNVGDYTDFYSSKEHATNVGSMFRDPNNALLPNWLHIPVGYHGRSSSIVPTGKAIHRPYGQSKPIGAKNPIFGPSKLVDFELEMAFITSDANKLGQRVSIDKAEDYIFGLVLLNDWSARDIQAWEYVPLGPFLGKSFGSTISPWIITLDALEPFKVKGPKQAPPPFPYLQQSGEKSFDINLSVYIKPENGDENLLTHTNFKYMYWSMAQQLTHHTVNGCNVNAGDMMGSGTISGPTKDSYGSMLELTWRGKYPIKLSDGTERKFINDNDTVIMRAYCQNNNVRIGFGDCVSKLLPAVDFKK